MVPTAEATESALKNLTFEDDNDKFESLESDSSDYFDAQNREEWHNYRKQRKESDGFDVGPAPLSKLLRFCVIDPTDFNDCDSSTIEDVKNSTLFAIDDYNRHKCLDKRIELVEILKANEAGYGHYITFLAKDSLGHSATYQAKVYNGVTAGIPLEVEIFRRKTEKKQKSNV